MPEVAMNRPSESAAAEVGILAPLAQYVAAPPRQLLCNELVVSERRPFAMTLLRGNVEALSPSEGWELLRYAPDAALAVSEHGGALDSSGCHAVDLTHARASVRFEGAHAMDALASGCPMDLSTIADGAAAASVLGPFHVLLQRHSTNCIDVYVTRSYAEALWDWLDEATSEWRVND